MREEVFPRDINCLYSARRSVLKTYMQAICKLNRFYLKICIYIYPYIVVYIYIYIHLEIYVSVQ